LIIIVDLFSRKNFALGQYNFSPQSRSFFKLHFYWVGYLQRPMAVHDGQIAGWFEESLCDSTGKVPQVLL